MRRTRPATRAILTASWDERILSPLQLLGLAVLVDLAELSGKFVQRLITQPSVHHTEGIGMFLVQVLAMTQLRSKDTQAHKAGRY